MQERCCIDAEGFSALQRAEIAEIRVQRASADGDPCVSVLFNEPKLLKSRERTTYTVSFNRFSALQRAEIAEMVASVLFGLFTRGFSALQRAEIAEIHLSTSCLPRCWGFSALQRAEIAEIVLDDRQVHAANRFSALQRAEIAEIGSPLPALHPSAH